jgi:hypothetical protein
MRNAFGSTGSASCFLFHSSFQICSAARLACSALRHLQYSSVSLLTLTELVIIVLGRWIACLALSRAWAGEINGTIIISTLVTLLAAGIGGFFALRAVSHSHALERAAQTEPERELSNRVRTMLSLEIEENYFAFEKYEAGIDERVLFLNGKHQPKERAQQLSDTPMPLGSYSQVPTSQLIQVTVKGISPAQGEICPQHCWHLPNAIRPAV